MATSTSVAASQSRARRRSTPLLTSLAAFDNLPRKWAPSPTSIYSASPPPPTGLQSTSLQPTPTLPYRKSRPVIASLYASFGPKPTESLQSSTPTIDEGPSTPSAAPTIRVIAPKGPAWHSAALDDDEEELTPRFASEPEIQPLEEPDKPLPKTPQTFQAYPFDSSQSSSRNIKRKKVPQYEPSDTISSEARLPPYIKRDQLPSYHAPSSYDSQASSGLDTVTSMQSTADLLKGRVEDRNSIALRRALERIGIATKEVQGDMTPLLAAGAIKKPKRDRWTGAKVVLLCSVTALMSYALAGLACAITTWTRTWPSAEVFILLDSDVLIYITVASVLCLVTAICGLAGSLLNSRRILTIYALLLWPSFLALLMIGYTSYRRQSLSLDRKLNQAWSERLDDLDRLRVQNSVRTAGFSPVFDRSARQLGCCGYYNSLHDATYSKRCYPRTMLPGCKGKLFRFENDILHRCFVTAFAIVPLHIFNIVASILCSNHVNRTFGKGILPAQYHLSMADVRSHAMRILDHFPPPLPEKPRRDSEDLFDDSEAPLSMARTASSRSSTPSFDSMPSEDALSGLGFIVEDEQQYQRR